MVLVTLSLLLSVTPPTAGSVTLSAGSSVTVAVLSTCPLAFSSVRTNALTSVECPALSAIRRSWISPPDESKVVGQLVRSKSVSAGSPPESLVQAAEHASVEDVFEQDADFTRTGRHERIRAQIAGAEIADDDVVGERRAGIDRGQRDLFDRDVGLAVGRQRQRGTVVVGVRIRLVGSRRRIARRSEYDRRIDVVPAGAGRKFQAGRDHDRPAGREIDDQILVAGSGAVAGGVVGGFENGTA